MPPKLEMNNISSVLDKEQRETLEDIVIEMREEVEADLQAKLYETYQVVDKDNPPSELDEKELEIREQLIRAIEREQLDEHTWGEALERYRRSVGFTNINRFCAFRAMEVRDLIDRPVTRFKEGNRTPASDPIIEEEFETPEDAFFHALHRQGDEIAEEIELLFNRSGPYSLLEPSFSTAKKLCSLMDELGDEIWAADDVLGWVYEYYNVPDLGDVRSRAKDADDVIKGNQFYTPHWVVRQLTDNTLGKMFLEYKGELQEAIEYQQEHFDQEGRKYRSIAPEDSSTVKDLCTYLVPTETEGEGPDWEDPSEIKVFDPACGSGHFLLYAFDVLERIWWEMRPEVSKEEVPELILENNIYGIDLDLRATQLAAFNLWMKAKQRTQEEGGESFSPDRIQIVCADARLVDTDPVEEIFEQVAEKEEVQQALENLVDTFENVHALGSLLNVKGTMEEVFKKENGGSLFGAALESKAKSDMADFFDDLHEAIEAQENGESQLYSQDLKSFTRLLKLLSQEYDVSLMNPPYGHRSRMPKTIRSYVKANFHHYPEFYINFFEQARNLAKKHSHAGMLVPSSFMYKRSFSDFRERFLVNASGFELLTELGLGILDNATVDTVTAIVNTGSISTSSPTSNFFRLHDVDVTSKEAKYLSVLCNKEDKNEVQRKYTKTGKEFNLIPGAPCSYWVPKEIRSIYESDILLDSDNAKVERDSLGVVKQGLATGNNDRFVRYFWEAMGPDWAPFTMGGEYAYLVPELNQVINWEYSGREVKTYPGARPQNLEYYFNEGVTFNYIKTKDGRRFGYLPKHAIFSHAGDAVLGDTDPWGLMAYLNSELVTYLMIAQTTHRQWEVNLVAKLPWEPAVSESKELRNLSKDLASIFLDIRRRTFSASYYTKPWFLDFVAKPRAFPYLKDHPNRSSFKTIDPPGSTEINSNDSFKDMFSKLENYWEELREKAQIKHKELNNKIFDRFEIGDRLRKVIRDEIEMRLDDDPRNPQLIPEKPKFLFLLKQLIMHFTMSEINNKGDGIVLLNSDSDDNEPALLNRIKTQFQNHFDDYAQDRMREADEALGSKSSTEEMFPNIRNWLENYLFKFHLSEFENTPIVWKLTSRRLGDLSNVEGFSCLIDYHQLDGQTLDRIRNQYLDDRKAVLTEKRNQARRRADDESLSPEERQEAEEKITEYREAHEQVEALDETLKELGQVHPRDWTEEDQEFAQEVHQKVERFEERMKERLNQIDRLVDLAGKEFVKDLYSENMLNRIEEETEGWFEDLEDLKEACKAYAKSNEKSVPAHLYDLFDYCREKTIKSTNFNSSGFLFMNFYLKDKENYSRDSRTDVDQEVLKLVEKLSAESTKDVNLGEEIRDDLKELSKSIPSDWKDRAVQEVMNEGYTPIEKHGVAINIAPLADAKVVPEIVEDKVVLS